MAQLPRLKALVERHRDQPFAVIGINSDGNREKVAPRLAKEGIRWRNAIDETPRGPIATLWNVRARPTTYVIDARGVVRARAPRGDEIDAAVDALLREPP